ncbi:MAG4940 family membrane protein [Mycoplasma zalophidermidis]|uniref:Transmembrane protein n=1 Tax=Mycoplasma zalophidermidis TaxID=398174 RepID=A0ABS6DRN4_9MOLU|nr:hypothetical protein [Mycoplasma zalophidermidis]MBU4689884.1 hypothetical protein [Mycoplasma zalophidermidis]MBU4693670.1 hypothetical protein [Mycoplasma zalophidermidis]MCR8966754.1 hypothetical protein [Mycoplasma zalophidermidis]
MTPKQLLSTNWSSTGFLYEFLATFTLVFFTMIWMFIAKLTKKDKNKIYMTFGLTFVTFLMFVIPWSWSHFLSSKASMPLANPLIVILQAMLQGIDIKNHSISPIFSGVSYLIGAQILGGVCAFILFTPLHFLMRNYFIKHHSEYDAKNISLLRIFQNNEDCNSNVFKFTIKEFIFISLFVTTVPLLSYISQVNFGTNGYDKMIITILVIWFTLYLSAFFGFYGFHLYFSFMNLVTSVILIIIVALKKLNDQKRESMFLLKRSSINFSIILIFTFAIPIIFALIIFGITNISSSTLNF